MSKKYVVEYEVSEFESSSALSNCIRGISWYGGETKIDIGKWANLGSETEFRRSGVSFTVAETNSLTETLVREGFGNKDNIIQALKDRKVERIGEKKSTTVEVKSDTEEIATEYYDPKEALV